VSASPRSGVQWLDAAGDRVLPEHPTGNAAQCAGRGDLCRLAAGLWRVRSQSLGKAECRLRKMVEMLFAHLN
jgi:hypothetical protein